jgi:hypothetical protein
MPAHKLKMLSASELEALVRTAKPLISDSTNPLDRILVGYRLHSVPADERAVFVQNCQFLFACIAEGRLTEGYADRERERGFKISVLENLKNRSIDQRQAIVQYVQLLLPNSRRPVLDWYVIQSVVSMRAGELVAIPENQLQVFKKILADEFEISKKQGHEIDKAEINRRLTTLVLLRQLSALVLLHAESFRTVDQQAFDRQAFGPALSLAVPHDNGLQRFAEECDQESLAEQGGSTQSEPVELTSRL